MTHDVKGISPQQWLDDLECIVRNFIENDNNIKPPYYYSTGVRILNIGCLPVVCAPCITWSAIWRIICCPIACCSRGAGHMCAGNSCTNVSDGCVSAYVKDILSHRQLPRIPNITLFSAEERLQLEKTLEVVADLFNIDMCNYKPAHYALAEVLFTNTFGDDKSVPYLGQFLAGEMLNQNTVLINNIS